MANNRVMIEELKNDVFYINDNSSLVKMIEFGFLFQHKLIEINLIEECEWYDFAFEINLKTVEDSIIYNINEINLILDWLDWICRILILYYENNHQDKFVKKFFSECDELFLFFKKLNKKKLD